MTYRVVLTAEARGDLARLRLFLSSKSTSAADTAIAAISNAILSLEELPSRGRRVGPGGERELVVPFGRYAYLVQYRADADTVVVARILHSHEIR